MGLFGNKARPSKDGSYRILWPSSSGLAPGFHEDYLVYTSARRQSEGVPAEDAEAMATSQRVLDQIGLANEALLIAGPVDLGALDEPSGSEFAAMGALTGRSTVFWWQGRRGCADEYVVLPHQNLQPKGQLVRGYHFVWSQGGANDYPPFGDPSLLRALHMPGFSVAPHFSKDGHGNRRGASVQATLQYVRGDH